MSQNKTRKFTPTKSSKSALQKKNINNAQSQSIKTGSTSSKKPSTGVANRSEEASESNMGLPEFCTTCERQMVTPTNSVLYCSESCRMKDASLRPVSIQTALSPSIQTSNSQSYFDVPDANIVPQRSPTVLRPPSTNFSDFSTSEPPSPTEASDDSDVHPGSEAARYLAQFHSHSYTGERVRARRPRANRNSSTADKIPSLSHTPSSSYGTVASLERPLPRRHRFGPGQLSPKSVDLVIPSFSQDYSSNPQYSLGNSSMESSASTITAIQSVDEGSKSYERRKLALNSRTQASGGLKDLFSHEKIQASTNYERTAQFQQPDRDQREAAAIRGL